MNIKKIFLILLLFICFGIGNNTLFAAPSGNTVEISIEHRKKLNKLVIKIDSIISENGGKESDFYKKIISNLDEKIREIRKINFGKTIYYMYVKNGLENGVQQVSDKTKVERKFTYLIPLVGIEDKKYMELLEKLDKNFANGGMYIEKNDREVEIISKYKNIILNLFNKKKLLILKTFSIGGKKIFVISLYKQTKVNIYSGCDDLNNGGCVLVSEDNDIYFGKDIGGIKLSKPKKRKNINDQYIYLYENFSYGGGVGENSILLDKNLNLLSKSRYYHALSSEIEYQIGNNLYISVLGDIDNRNQGGNLIKNPISYKIFSYFKIPSEKFKDCKECFDLKKQVKKYVITDENNFKFDLEKNTVSLYEKGEINFTIGGKKYKLKKAEIERLKKQSKSFDEIQGDIHVTPKISLYKNNGNYSLVGRYQNLEETNIKKIEILSCVENRNIYDANYYELKNFKSGDKEFTYNISEKFGNKCNLPYKIKFTQMDGKVIKKEFEIEF